MSSENPIQNLDVLCAEVGRRIADISDMEERTLNAALRVLEEQGPHAMFLYVQAKHRSVAEEFDKHCAELLKEIFIKVSDETNTLKMVKKLAENLDDLLFTRDLLLTSLSYARYYLKIKGVDK